MLALALALSAGATSAGPGRGDLTARFADVPRAERDGATYYLRGRVTTVMVTGVMPDAETGLPATDFVALFAIDDDAKRITPIYIDGDTIVSVEGESLPMGKVYGLGEDSQRNCLRMLDAVNRLLGHELIESYMAVDLEGITEIAEFSALRGDTRERLHLLRLAMQNIPSKQLNRMYGAISAYLTTDMKSGEVMRMIDKTDRYEIAATVDLPVLPAQTEDEPPVPDAARISELVLDLFFEPELL